MRNPESYNGGANARDDGLAAAGRALARGDPLGALNRVALREDAAALALRGIALAQLGEFSRARALVRRAARAFGARFPAARARCVIAEGEIALAVREFGWPEDALEAARVALEAHGDWVNARHARLLAVRRLLLIGRLDDAERALARTDPASLPPQLLAVHELIAAGVALRRIRTRRARAAFARADRAARQAGIPALVAEVALARTFLDTPAARLLAGGRERILQLAGVESVLASAALVVDACRLAVRHRRQVVSLTRRPVLFVLVRALAEAWPGEASRDVLIARAFGGRCADESHRTRLRVEITRLRQVVRSMAGIRATPRGFALRPLGAREVVVLAPPADEAHAALLGCLADGEAWSSSALALGLGASVRTVQRALESLAAAGKVHPIGQGRSRRWTTPALPGVAAPLLPVAPQAATDGSARSSG